MPATMNLDINQIKKLITQFNDDEKLELAKYMDKLTLKDRFEKLFRSIKEVRLTFEEITTEVETVREEQHKYHSSKPQ